MRINNFTELSNFLQSNGLNNLGQNLTNCVNQYAALCVCKPDERINKLNECYKLYSDTIYNVTRNKSVVFRKINDSRIEFYSNNKLVSTVLR